MSEDEKPVMRDEKGRIIKGSGFIPGAGRKTGQSPHRKFTWDVKQLCEESGANPFQTMIDIMQDEENSPKLRQTAASELARYIAPQLKSMEIKSETQTQVVFAWADGPAIPTINSDGTPVIEHRPVVPLKPGRVADEVASLLDPEQD
jgi:hypothetical protein